MKDHKSESEEFALWSRRTNVWKSCSKCQRKVYLRPEVNLCNWCGHSAMKEKATA